MGGKLHEAATHLVILVENLHEDVEHVFLDGEVAGSVEVQEEVVVVLEDGDVLFLVAEEDDVAEDLQDLLDALGVRDLRGEVVKR